MDFVKDTISNYDYCMEEDPQLYISEKTGRGPLDPETWIMDQLENKKPVMCCYKICRVEFRYWGLQNRVERWIHDLALKVDFKKSFLFFKGTMLRAHRQAWAWQDEWIGLTIDDIRKLEDEAKHYLSNVMSKSNEDSSIEKSQKTDLITFEETDLADPEEAEDNESSDVFFDCFEPSPNLIIQKNNNKHAQMLRWSSELLLMGPENENRKNIEPLSGISAASNHNNRTLLILVFHGDIFPMVYYIHVEPKLI